jgi:hypothetical protein
VRAGGSGRVAAVVVRAEVDHGRAELVADPDSPLAWTLLVDGTAQSHVDLGDPTHLEFEYVRRIGHLLDALDPPPPSPLRVLHLGGGAWTLPRYVAATRPRSPSGRPSESATLNGTISAAAAAQATDAADAARRAR